MNGYGKTSVTLLALTVIFLALAAAFIFNVGGRSGPLPSIPLVSTNFLDTATARRSYADLVKAGEDLSDFDCYACHDKGKPPPMRFDTNQNLIIPKEHSDIVMHHGSHERKQQLLQLSQRNQPRTLPDEGQTRTETRGQRSALRQLPRPDVSRLGSRRPRPDERILGSFTRRNGPETLRELPQPALAEIPGRKPAPGPASVAGWR
jgi:hypothetical protein